MIKERKKKMQRDIRSRKAEVMMIINQCCINCERSLRRKSISFCENSGLAMAATSSFEADDGNGDDGDGGRIIMSVTDSEISSTKSTITPSIPITYCMYTASPTLLQTPILNQYIN